MSSKTSASTLISALKSSLKTRDMTYRGLATKLQISEASVKRLFAEETFTLKRIEEICDVLEIDFFELARRARGASADTAEMSTRQEEALAADAHLLGLFYLVLSDWQVDAILENYDIDRAECTRLLLQLDRLGLIELGTNDHVRLKVPRSLRVQRDGPIRRTHGKSAVSDFLQADFAAEDGFFHFEFRELSRTSIVHLERKLARLAQEMHELADIDSYLPPDQRETAGLALGIRPWLMSWMNGIRKREAPANEKTRADKGAAST